MWASTHVTCPLLSAIVSINVLAVVVEIHILILICSVAEPPLFWAAQALAPDGLGPGADSGSDLHG